MLRDLLKRAVMPFVLDQIRAPWPQRQFLRNLLQRLEIDCVLDVGANVGQFGEELRLIGYSGLIISFEPDPETYAKLVANIAGRHKWVALNLALGSASGTAELNIMASSAFNSFRAPSSVDTKMYEDANRVVKSVHAEVDTLSRLLPDLMRTHGFSRPFLKMDTQGFDVEIFRGAREVYPLIAGLQSELPIKHLYEGTLPWEATVAEYQNAGFAPAGFYQVNPGYAELIELDCYFVRQPEQGSALHPRA
jgi:FkbM family methyltransferase